MKANELRFWLRFMARRDGKELTITEPLKPEEIDSPATQAAIKYFTERDTPVVVREFKSDD